MKGGEEVMVDIVDINTKDYDMNGTEYQKYATLLATFVAHQEIVKDILKKQKEINNKILDLKSGLKKKVA